MALLSTTATPAWNPGPSMPGFHPKRSFWRTRETGTLCTEGTRPPTKDLLSIGILFQLIARR